MLPGSGRLVLKLRELDRSGAFLSNNPTRDPELYAEKLTKLGLETSAGEVVNPVVAMARWLLHSHPDAAVFPIAEEPPKDALRGAGIGMSEYPA